MYSLLQSKGIVHLTSPLALVSLVLTMTAGTIVAVWLGELITEYGFTNGVSILIFAGIVSRLPITLVQSATTIQAQDILKVSLFLAMSAVVVAVIVFMNEATRQIPISYARRAGPRCLGFYFFISAPKIKPGRRYSDHLCRVLGTHAINDLAIFGIIRQLKNCRICEYPCNDS